MCLFYTFVCTSHTFLHRVKTLELYKATNKQPIINHFMISCYVFSSVCKLHFHLKAFVCLFCFECFDANDFMIRQRAYDFEKKPVDVLLKMLLLLLLWHEQAAWTVALEDINIISNHLSWCRNVLFIYIALENSLSACDVVFFSTGGGEEREVHNEPGLVGPRMHNIWNDRGQGKKLPGDVAVLLFKSLIFKMNSVFVNNWCTVFQIKY